MRIAVLGVGGVGGLLAGALDRAGAAVTVIARPSTAELINARGLRVNSVRLGEFIAHPQALERLTEPVDVLIVATKATTLAPALQRIVKAPTLTLPLLNGLDHLTVLRERLGTGVLAGSIRVEADRPKPGVVMHTSPFLRVDIASREQAAGPGMQSLAYTLSDAGIPARVTLPISAGAEAQVIWGKLVRLNALACTTSAYDKLLGEIRSERQMYGDLLAVIQEGCAVALAEGASIDSEEPIAELSQAHATLGSSMQRDIAAGRTPELDAIPGAVLRAGARHGIPCPTTERLAAVIAKRAGVKAPDPAAPSSQTR